MLGEVHGIAKICGNINPSIGDDGSFYCIDSGSTYGKDSRIIIMMYLQIL